MLLTCCSKESDVNAQETQTPANGKVLVAYFSFTSNTKAYAEKIAQMTGSDLYEIVPEVAYGSENSNYYDETINRQSSRFNNIYSLDGRLLSKALDISSLKRGIYIIDGKKTIIQ